MDFEHPALPHTNFFRCTDGGSGANVSGKEQVVSRRSAGPSIYQVKVIIIPQHEDISVQDRLQVGNKAFADGQHLPAQAAFEAVIERDPNNAQVLLGWRESYSTVETP